MIGKMDDKLRQFEAAALRYDFSDCEPLIEDIFQTLTVECVIKIALEMLKSHFPLFEKHHPEIEWPRDWLGYIERRETVDGSSPCFYDEDRIYDDRGVASPGSRSFIEAMEFLHSTYWGKYSDEKRVEVAAWSVQNSITARTAAFWAEFNPQAYDAYMGNPNINKFQTLEQMSDPKNRAEVERMRNAAQEYRTNARVNEFRKGLCMELIRLIEENCSQ